MKKIFFAFIMASSAFLCAQSYEHTNTILNPLMNQDNQETSVRQHIEDLVHPHCSNSGDDSGGSGHHHHKKVFGAFYTTSDGTFALVIPLTNTSFAKDVSLNIDGSITVNKRGNYLVNFGVSGQSTGDVSPLVGLIVNGVGQPGTLIALSGTGLTSASTIIHVSKSNVPATLALFNASLPDIITGLPTPIALLPNGGISAFLSIERLND